MNRRQEGEADDQQNATLDHIIANEIRRRRLALGLTQEEVAERLGVAKTTLSYVENNHRKITAHHLEQFAEVFGCEPRDLLPTDPARAQLDDAVNARDPDAIAQALAALGIDLPMGDVENPAPPRDAGAGSEAVDTMVAAQLRATAELIEKRSHLVVDFRTDEDPLRLFADQWLTACLDTEKAAGRLQETTNRLEALVEQYERQWAFLEDIRSRSAGAIEVLSSVSPHELRQLIEQIPGLPDRESEGPADPKHGRSAGEAQAKRGRSTGRSAGEAHRRLEEVAAQFPRRLHKPKDHEE